MSYHITTPDINDLFNEDRDKALRKEVADFQTCVKGNKQMFLALTDFTAISGHRLDPGCCAPVSDDTLQTILQDLLELILEGIPINGKLNGWSVGCFGSRWIDMNPSKYGIDHIRCSFYSKKHHKGKWTHPKPYALHITAEKARR